MYLNLRTNKFEPPLPLPQPIQHVYRWTEPSIASFFRPYPACEYNSTRKYLGIQPTQNNVFTRVGTCELMYGPVNCKGKSGGEPNAVLSHDDIRDIAKCGFNALALDILDVPRARAYVWSWAPGFPSFTRSEDGRESGARLCTVARVSGACLFTLPSYTCTYAYMLTSTCTYTLSLYILQMADGRTAHAPCPNQPILRLRASPCLQS